MAEEKTRIWSKWNWKAIGKFAGWVTSIVVAVVGGGKLQVKEINSYLSSNIINVSGDNNTVVVNDWKDLASAYNNLLEGYATIKQENTTLKWQNEQYFNDYTEQKDLNESLKLQMSDGPDLMYESLGLSIDGDNIPVDSNNSIVNINGREYWSQEIVTKLLPENESYSKENGNINVGRVLADKTSLFALYVNSKNGGKLNEGAVNDSFNNTHSNAFVGTGYHSNITLLLDGKYSKLKISAAIKDDCSDSVTASFTIKTDDGEVVYSSPLMNVKTEPFEVTDIPINNCKLLTIDCSSSSDSYCTIILYDAVVYN